MTESTTPAAIDVHAHVFNGSDIPVERFVRLVRARKTPALLPLAGILQLLAWTIAPTGKDELKKLATFQSLGAEDVMEAMQRQADIDRVTQYQYGVEGLREALDRHRARNPRFGLTPAEARTEEIIRNLPPTLPEGASLRTALVEGLDDEISAAIRFVLQMLQYRYVNALTFLGIHGTRQVGLAFCHMLDFDWCLADGDHPKTRLETQIQVMERLSTLTGGKIHGYAPFDPFKQVAAELGLTSERPLELVKDAITKHGHVGVKMYLPMGFAPYGNAGKPASFWNREWIRNDLKVPDLGARLDRALAALYAWCRGNDVPIMAHTSPSNGPADEFEKLTCPFGWTRVPQDGLRVNFGHFGDTEIGIREPYLARAYAALMDRAGTHGAHFFADSAYFTDVVHNPPALRDALVGLLRSTSAKGEANLAHRLMYGSDWAMLLIEPGDVSSYLPTFEAMFSALEGDGSLGASGRISDAFFTRNAIGYAGLAAGNPTRTRLDAFHARTGSSPPSWAALVDALSGSA